MRATKTERKRRKEEKIKEMKGKREKESIKSKSLTRPQAL